MHNARLGTTVAPSKPTPGGGLYAGIIMGDGETTLLIQRRHEKYPD